jgi:hypothetical protein
VGSERAALAPPPRRWHRSAMRAFLLPVLCLLAAACSAERKPSASAAPSPEERRQQRLMDEIEGRLTLPRGAHRLSDYARFYGDAPGGKVAATYVIPRAAEPASREGCSTVDVNGTGQDGPCPAMPAWPRGGVGAGQRKWVRTVKDFPFMADGGCAQVDIRYDPARRAFEVVSCNGTL